MNVVTQFHSQPSMRKGLRPADHFIVWKTEAIPARCDATARYCCPEYVAPPPEKCLENSDSIDYADE